MKKSLIKVVVFMLFFGAMACFAEEEKRTAPTHADAAVILAKFSGLFDRYVDKEASLNECVSFLNEKGIYFGLMEVVNGKEFTERDCAMALGQVELVLSGEAEYFHGKVKLPKGVDSWEIFCIMNGVEYVNGYRVIVEWVGRARQFHH